MSKFKIGNKHPWAKTRIYGISQQWDSIRAMNYEEGKHFSSVDESLLSSVAELSVTSISNFLTSKEARNFFAGFLFRYPFLLFWWILLTRVSNGGYTIGDTGTLLFINKYSQPYAKACRLFPHFWQLACRLFCEIQSAFADSLRLFRPLHLWYREFRNLSIR